MKPPCLRGSTRPWLSVSALLLLTGCSSATLPLCPLLAEWSYPTAGEGKVVNYYIQQAADDKAISVRPLSAFLGYYRGNEFGMKWLISHYREMLCAFDPRKVTGSASPSQVYLSCMAHADRWIEVVQRDPHDLFLGGTEYYENCAAVDPNGRTTK